jgi:hypothetical protein
MNKGFQNTGNRKKTFGLAIVLPGDWANNGGRPHKRCWALVRGERRFGLSAANRRALAGERAHLTPSLLPHMHRDCQRQLFLPLGRHPCEHTLGHHREL